MSTSYSHTLLDVVNPGMIKVEYGNEKCEESKECETIHPKDLEYYKKKYDYEDLDLEKQSQIINFEKQPETTDLEESNNDHDYYIIKDEEDYSKNDWLTDEEVKEKLDEFKTLKERMQLGQIENVEVEYNRLKKTKEINQEAKNAYRSAWRDENDDENDCENGDENDDENGGDEIENYIELPFDDKTINYIKPDLLCRSELIEQNSHLQQKMIQQEENQYIQELQIESLQNQLKIQKELNNGKKLYSDLDKYKDALKNIFACLDKKGIIIVDIESIRKKFSTKDLHQ